jgi:putative phosphoesterase
MDGDQPGTALAVISDTHLPRGSRALPRRCIERLREADLIIHAGDLTALSVLEELHRYNEVAAIHGNVDDAEVVAALPAELELDIRGCRLAVIHDAGKHLGRLERLRRRFPDAQAVIFGHSHIPLHVRDSAGFQIFNPGSPTDRRRSPHHTMGVAFAARGRVAFELIELD